jgi:putative N6-adenine-specific DNA methylase
MSRRPETLPLFAVSAPGLEPVLAAELADLGMPGQVETGGVSWSGSLEQLHRANLELRTASRVLLRVGEFRARTFFELERHARRLEWQRYLGTGRRVQLRVTCRKSRLYHEGAVAQRFLEAISRAAGDTVGSADDGSDAEEEGSAAQLFVIRFFYDRCTVSIDSSGALLHLRGYRQALARAPLRETLAAALLRVGGWRAHAPLLDPLCGSGTIPIEAALAARRIAPGLAGKQGTRPRAYAFEQWPDHRPELWGREVDRAREAVLAGAGVAILGSDRDAGAIDAALANAERAGVAADLALRVAPLSAVDVPAAPAWLVTNPPYGVRVGETRALRDLYAALGKLARTRIPGGTLAMLSADPGLERQVGIPMEARLGTRNGGIPVRIMVGQVPG